MYYHIPPVLGDLHWLLVASRIIFKLMLFTFYLMTKSYSKEIIPPYIPTRSLHSEETCWHEVPMTKLKGFDDRSFAKEAPSI